MLRATILRPSSAPADVTTDERVVRIVVAEHPTTGYRWVLATRPPGLIELEEDDFEPPLDPAPGAGGRRVFVLRAERSGTAVVELSLVRAWQPQSPSDALVVRVEV